MSRSLDVDRKEVLLYFWRIAGYSLARRTRRSVTSSVHSKVDGHSFSALESLERIYGSRGQNKELGSDLSAPQSAALRDQADIVPTRFESVRGSLYESQVV